MRDEAPPTRLREASGTEPSLADALDLARREMPTTEQMERLASALAPQLSSTALKASRRRILPFAAGTTATLLAAAVAAMGVGASFRYFSAGNREPVSALEPPPSLAARPSFVAPTEPETVVPNGAPAVPSDVSSPPVAEKMTGVDQRRDRAAPAASGPAQTGSAAPTGAASFPDTVAPTEIALLGRAQRALASDPAGALGLTEEHAARFPNGVLNQEREFIAIQALLALGKRSDAVARANQFRANFPGSAHLRRLDLLLGN